MKTPFFRPPPRAGAAGAITLHTPAQNEPPLPPPPLRGPAAARRVPAPRGPAGKAAAAPARAAHRIWPRLPLCRRAAPPPGNGPPAPATGPACPPKRAAPFFRRAAAHRAPRLCPGENRRAPPRVPAGRPPPAPPGVLPPAQGRARRPKGPTGPRQGVPAPARRATWRVPPRGDQIPRGAVCARPERPLSRNFRINLG